MVADEPKHGNKDQDVGRCNLLGSLTIGSSREGEPFEELVQFSIFAGHLDLLPILDWSRYVLFKANFVLERIDFDEG